MKQDHSVRDVVLAFLLIGLLALAAHAAGVVICPLKRFTGIPCPTCGTTRACVALLKGDVAGAFGLNPLATAALLLGPSVWWLSRGRTWPRAVRVFALAAAVPAVLLNWWYVLVRDGVLPAPW